jgi:hypothetical protein
MLTAETDTSASVSKGKQFCSAHLLRAASPRRSGPPHPPQQPPHQLQPASPQLEDVQPRLCALQNAACKAQKAALLACALSRNEERPERC